MCRLAPKGKPIYNYFTTQGPFRQPDLFDNRKTIKLATSIGVQRAARLPRRSASSMDLQIQGKRALVTGSSAGIGEAIAKSLAQEGVFVVVHGRREAEVRRVVQQIETAGGRAIATLGD